MATAITDSWTSNRCYLRVYVRSTSHIKANRCSDCWQLPLFGCIHDAVLSGLSAREECSLRGTWAEAATALRSGQRNPQASRIPGASQSFRSLGPVVSQGGTTPKGDVGAGTQYRMNPTVPTVIPPSDQIGYRMKPLNRGPGFGRPCRNRYALRSGRMVAGELVHTITDHKGVSAFSESPYQETVLLALPWYCQ